MFYYYYYYYYQLFIVLLVNSGLLAIDSTLGNYFLILNKGVYLSK